jgi:hypothetical protein
MSIIKDAAVLLAYVWFFIIALAAFDPSELPDNPINQLAETVATISQ